MKPSVSQLNRAMVGALAAATAVALTACGAQSEGAASDSAAATHSVEHARGATEVPRNPSRVVVLEPVHLDTALALGVVPVGTAVLSEATGVPAYLGEEASTIEMVGTVAAPDVEEIAALQPDLVIGTQTRHGELYDRLSAVAPTIFMASQADPWQDNVRFVAGALGKSAEAQGLLDEYGERCAEIGAKHGTEGKTAQLIRPRDNVLTLYGPTSFAGSTLECAGFTIPSRDWENSISVDLSLELATEAKADLVVVTSAKPGDPTTMPAAVTENARYFPSLHLVDMSYWITGVGPIGGMAVLDDLDRILGADR